jgi:hypothetical protein
MLSDEICEMTVDYPVAEVGSPPFANILHFRPQTEVLDPEAELSALLTAFKNEWDGVTTLLDSGLTGITATGRYLQAGVVWEDSIAVNSGGVTSSQLVGGASVRVKFVTQHGPKQRNGGVYIPALPSTASTVNTGAVAGTFATNLGNAINDVLTLATTGSVDWELVVMSKIADTDPAEYEARDVVSASVASQVTFYDGRY